MGCEQPGADLGTLYIQEGLLFPGSPVRKQAGENKTRAMFCRCASPKDSTKDMGHAASG